jgi:hypothetical protein
MLRQQGTLWAKRQTNAVTEDELPKLNGFLAQPFKFTEEHVPQFKTFMLLIWFQRWLRQL